MLNRKDLSAKFIMLIYKFCIMSNEFVVVMYHSSGVVFRHAYNFCKEFLKMWCRILWILTTLHKLLDIHAIVISSRDDFDDPLTCDIPINAYTKINAFLDGVLDVGACNLRVTLTKKKVSITKCMLKATNMH